MNHRSDVLTVKRLLTSDIVPEDVTVQPKDSVQTAIPAVIVTEYDICCQQLRSVLERESAVGFLCVCCAISILATRLRPLHKQEVVAAVKLNKSMCGEESGHFCFSVSNQMMAIDDKGVVDFANPKMKDFLKTFHIRGIDISHRTIAKICRMQKDIDAKSVQELLAFDAGIHVNSPFSGYAAKYWEIHQKQAYG